MLYTIKSFPETDEKAKKLGEKPYIHPTSRVTDSKLGSWTEIGENCDITETIFDDYSYAAGNASIIYSEIGKFCSIASHVRINPGNHPMQRVTQHHCTYRRAQFGFGTEDDTEFFNWRREHKCIIGHDVWIGHAAIIMPGVTIGTGAVIGAGAVVSRDVAPYSIVVGVPAQPIKKRFPDEIIEKLLDSKWWDWDKETFTQRFEHLKNIDLFLKIYCNN
ncbi:MAG TPA: DapH/DapD/GlmU-related protein [Clostridia bacterium]